MLHGGTSSRVKQQYIVPATGEVVDRKTLVKGYEYSKGQYVVFTDEELAALEAERSQSLDILEFVPLDTVDLIQVEKTYYLGPDKGGDKAYHLLSESMDAARKVAVGRWAAKGKEQLVLIRPYKNGLLLHQMFYANEVRAFDEVETGATFEFKEVEKELAQKLIAELTSKRFDPEKYRDEYADRLLAAVESKVAGKEIQVAAEVPKAQIIDLFEALKQSLEQARIGAASVSDAPSAVGSVAEEAPAGESASELKPRPPEKAGRRKSSTEKKKTGS